jgi:hypothetical protein
MLTGGTALRMLFPDRMDTILLSKDNSTVDRDGQPLQGTAVPVTKRDRKRTVADLTAMR